MENVEVFKGAIKTWKPVLVGFGRYFFKIHIFFIRTTFYKKMSLKKTQNLQKMSENLHPLMSVVNS